MRSIDQGAIFLQECLRGIDEKWKREAEYVDSAARLARLRSAKKARRREKRSISPVFGRVATVAVCLLLVVGLVLAVPELLQGVTVIFQAPDRPSGGNNPPIGTNQPTPPPSDPGPSLPTPPSSGEVIEIDSVDKLNYYSAMKILGDSGATPVWKSIDVLPQRREASPLSSSSGKIYYYEVNPHTVFTVSKVTYFQVELTRADGFLASRIGTGIVDVVYTENDLDDMITFRNGDRYYSCLYNGSDWLGGTHSEYHFSTHKYVEDLRLVKNLEQVNYIYTLHYEGDEIAYVQCEYRTYPETSEGTVPDQLRLIPNSQITRGARASFTIADLEGYFNGGGDGGENGGSATSRDGLEFYSNGDGTCMLVGYEDLPSGTVTVPAYSPSGERVTGVGAAAFRNCEELVSITLPEGVEEIGDRAFYGCADLREVGLPESLCRIGDSAFSYCGALSVISLPSALANVGSYAFSQCAALEEARMSEALIHLGAAAFKGCTSLRVATLPDTLTELADHVFAECESLRDLKLPSALTRIGARALAGTGLTHLSIPSAVAEIADGALAGSDPSGGYEVSPENPVYHTDGDCLIESATGRVIAGCSRSVLPTDGSVRSIAQDAFFNCYGLQSIIIPDSVTVIEPYAFMGCSNLRTVSMSSRIESIGEYAFASCRQVERIELPDTLTYIGTWAFFEWRSLDRIEFLGTREQWETMVRERDWDLQAGEYVVVFSAGK